MAPPKNTLSLTKFLASVGCDLKIGYDWSAASDDNLRVVFTIWQDELSNEHYTLWNKLSKKKIRSGGKRLLSHVNIGRQGNADIFGVLCHGSRDAEGKKHRSYYDEHTLLVLELSDEPERVTANVVGEVLVADIQAGNWKAARRPRRSAFDDLDQVPDGCENPQRKSKNVEVFVRDQMVRAHVRRRANGRCEFCGREGFLLANGSQYVEVHHILGLANEGPDTVENVIGLCAEHHREAHYGKHSKRLNSKLAGIFAKRMEKSDG